MCFSNIYGRFSNYSEQIVLFNTSIMKKILNIYFKGGDVHTDYFSVVRYTPSKIFGWEVLQFFQQFFISWYASSLI